MYKKIMAAVLLGFLGLGAFAEDSEEYGESYSGMIGVSYNNIIEKECGYLGAIGVNIGGYTFFNHKNNIGLFTLTSLNFVIAGKDNYESVFLYDQTLAAAFRHTLTEKLALLWAIGPHLSVFDIVYKPNDETASLTKRMNFGAAADISLKYSINNVLYIDFGVHGFYDFFTSGGTAKSDGYHKELTADYFLSGIKPRIILGSNARIFSGLRGTGDGDAL